jgi:hypothetical protein
LEPDDHATAAPALRRAPNFNAHVRAMIRAQLLCTHYCASGNQARLQAKAATKESDGSERVESVMKDITNLATVQSNWTSTEDEKLRHNLVFRMKRKA